MGKFLLRLRPSDILTIAFAAILLLIVVFFRTAIPKAGLLIILFLSLILLQIVFFILKDKNKLMGLIYNFVFPVLSVLIFFESVGNIVHDVNPNDIDALLAKIDFRIFGFHPTVFLERIMNPFLTDVLQLAYSSYYFLPIILGVVLLKDKKENEYTEALFLILLCFYLSYIGYLLFPALGPRFYLNHLQATELKGFLIAEPIQQILNKLEGIKRDAFPSGHTAIALTVLYLSCKFKLKIFWIFLIFVVALIFSTVYCRYHYVVDVAAGILLAIITVSIGEMCYEWWEKRKSPESF
jgi:membrane-associated phospholipid phosphatase